MHKIRRTVRRRRHEGKTDYKARFGMLKSEKPRVVFRKTNKYIIGQVVISEISQDKVIVSAYSKELMSYGWPDKLKGSLKNLTASYLTGYLLGKKSKKIRAGIFDVGLNRSTPKSRVYSFLKGVLDSGFSVPAKKEYLPEENLIIKKQEYEKLIKLIKENLDKNG